MIYQCILHHGTHGVTRLIQRMQQGWRLGSCNLDLRESDAALFHDLQLGRLYLKLEFGHEQWLALMIQDDVQEPVNCERMLTR